MSNKAKKYLKSILPEPEKRDFYELLHRAVRTTDKASRGTEKPPKTCGHAGKRTR